MPRHLLRLATVFIAACEVWTGAAAQKNSKNSASVATWPSRTLRIIVGFPAGSSPDLTARTLAEPLSKALGPSVIVENKVGAGGNIAADYVAKASDDHTIGLVINGNLTIARLLNPMLGGQLQLSLLPPALALAQIRAGKLRASHA